ncbi:MAG: hypothetical protein GY751_04535 [Bacteroidetes bacterium]|nr:hypothetical protein [Bacteroidota bacterium]
MKKPKKMETGELIKALRSHAKTYEEGDYTRLLIVEAAKSIDLLSAACGGYRRSIEELKQFYRKILE